MHMARGFINRARCGNERLPGNLAAKDADRIFFRRVPPEDVDFNDFEIEQGYKCVKRGGHHPIVGSFYGSFTAGC
jgi:hypothetical protein